MVKIRGILGVSLGILSTRAPVRAHHARFGAHDLARQLLWNCFGTTLGPSPHPHFKAVLPVQVPTELVPFFFFDAFG